MLNLWRLVPKVLWGTLAHNAGNLSSTVPHHWQQKYSQLIPVLNPLKRKRLSVTVYRMPCGSQWVYYAWDPNWIIITQFLTDNLRPFIATKMGLKWPVSFCLTIEPALPIQVLDLEPGYEQGGLGFRPLSELSWTNHPSTEKDKSPSHSHKYCTPKPTTPEHRVLSSEDAGHRDWRNVRKNNLQNMAKEPENPQQPLNHITMLQSDEDFDFIVCLNTWLSISSSFPIDATAYGLSTKVSMYVFANSVDATCSFCLTLAHIYMMLHLLHRHRPSVTSHEGLRLISGFILEIWGNGKLAVSESSRAKMSTISQPHLVSSFLCRLPEQCRTFIFSSPSWFEKRRCWHSEVMLPNPGGLGVGGRQQTSEGTLSRTPNQGAKHPPLPVYKPPMEKATMLLLLVLC